MELGYTQKYSFRKIFLKNVSLGMMSMLGQSMFILADTFFVAKGIGSEGIAALNIVLPMVNIINGIGWMLGVGGATLFSIAHGRKEIKKANQDFSYTIVFAGIIGLIFTVVTLMGSHQILRFLGASGSIYQMSKDYYEVISLFSLFFILNNVFITFLRNDGNAQLAMKGFTIGGFSNIVLDYLFVFPFNMGIRGAALASIVSPIVSLLILSHHRKNKSRTLSFVSFKKEIKPAFKIVSVGFSSFLNEFSSAFVMFLFNLILLELIGNIGVSAYAIIANMNIIAISLFTGIGQGIQPIVSLNFGSKNKEKTIKTLKYGVVTACLVGLVLFTIGFFFSQQIVNVFNSDNNLELAKIAEGGIRIYFSSFLFTGISFIVIYFMAAVQRPYSSLLISLLRGLVLIVPLLLLLVHVLGINGVWLAMPIVEIITAGSSILILYIYRKKFLS